MPLRDIENRAGVVYDPAKKNRIFAEDLQGLDTRITDLEDAPPAASAWGDLTGTLSDQTDLQEALDDLEAGLAVGGASGELLWNNAGVEDGIDVQWSKIGHASLLQHSDTGGLNIQSPTYLYFAVTNPADTTNFEMTEDYLNLVCDTGDGLYADNTGLVLLASQDSQVVLIDDTPASGGISLKTKNSILFRTVASANGAIFSLASISGSSKTFTFPNTTGNFVIDVATQTLTNKRITPRSNTIASSATPTPAGDTTDIFTVTALAAGATFAAPTGTPTNGQILTIRILDNGTARALAWNAIYRGSTTVALPTTTVVNKTMYLQFIYNSTTPKWDLLIKNDGF